MPVVTYASLEITEIMYDLEGTDSGLEWIEIHNTGSSPIAIDDWHFLENDVHHGLTADGFTELDPNSYALIVQDLAQASSNLGSDKLLIKSSFSLNNTGEPLALSDSEKTIVDSLTYSSEDGAAGNGKSLQLIDGVWREATPTPGAVPASGNTEESSDNNSTTTSSETVVTSSGGSSSKKQTSFYKGYFDLPTSIVAGSSAEFEFGAIHVRGGKETKKLKGIHFLNFGDGNSLESDTRIETDHIYQEPGSYTLVFEYYGSLMRFELGEDPEVLLKKTIQVLAHDIEIDEVTEEGIVIQNNVSKEIDISEWIIKIGEQSYVFPRNSFIQRQGSLFLSKETLGFNWLSPQVILHLYNAEGLLVDEYSYQEPVNVLLLEGDDIEPIDETELIFNDEPEQENIVNYLEKNPSKYYVEFADAASSDYVAETPSANRNRSLYFIFAAAFLALIASALKRSGRKLKTTDTEHVIGEIELIE